MTVNTKRLSSDYGFKSPGFSVDSNGNITGASLGINGLAIIDSAGTLTSNVKVTSIEVLGALRNLDVNGDTNIRSGSVSRISVTGGRVVIKSGTTGTIDNVNIGSTTAGTVTAYQINLTNNGTSPGSLNAASSSISLNNSTITGTATVSGTLLLSSYPTQATQAVRKDYVDNSTIAFAVVFGA
jgi:hypothetical protein